MKRGLFITFEGPEGAGKSTQIAKLAERLTKHRIKHLVTREPGGTTLGLRLREILLDSALEIDPLAELLLYSASRSQLVQTVIRPALITKSVVLCDRYTDSSYAYQGAGRGINSTFITELTQEVTDRLNPDLTVLLDLDPAVGLKRASARGQLDRLESADLNFHKRIRQRFLELANKEAERFLVLDATQAILFLEEKIWQVTQEKLKYLNLL